MRDLSKTVVQSEFSISETTEHERENEKTSEQRCLVCSSPWAHSVEETVQNDKKAIMLQARWKTHPLQSMGGGGGI